MSTMIDEIAQELSLKFVGMALSNTRTAMEIVERNAAETVTGADGKTPFERVKELREELRDPPEDYSLERLLASLLGTYNDFRTEAGALEGKSVVVSKGFLGMICLAIHCKLSASAEPEGEAATEATPGDVADTGELDIQAPDEVDLEVVDGADSGGSDEIDFTDA